MPGMDAERLAEELERQNPWWKTGRIQLEEGLIEREIFQKLKEELKENIITSVTGLRRAGKTTLLFQLIDHLLETEEEPNVLYFSFDLYQDSVRHILDVYFSDILKKTPGEEEVYIFLDEVQKVKNWSDQVKGFHDQHKNLKFIVSGSSSARILKGGGESLVGRMSINRINTFSFLEFLKFKDVTLPKKGLGEFPRPKQSRKIRTAFSEYMDTGGMAELLRLGSTKREERLKNIIDLTLFRDVVEMFGVARTEVLEAIFRQISSSSGNRVNYTKLAGQLDTEFKTVKKYINHLEDSFLIRNSRRFEKSMLKSYRRNPKIYVCEHSFAQLENAPRGLIAETVAFNHVKDLGKVGHWADSRGREVDIVLPEEKMALEVKYTDSVGREDAKELTKFLESHPDYRGIILSKNTSKEMEMNGMKIEVIPLWRFLVYL